MKTTNIYNYTDYRAFLKDYIKAQKTLIPHYSLGLWSRKMGISSTSVLVNVLTGKRNPGPSLQKKIIGHFNFDQAEIEYFKDLVKLSKMTSDPRLALGMMEKMKRQNNQDDLKVLNESAYTTTTKLSYQTLIAMVQLPEFKEDAEWIAKKMDLQMSASEIQTALQDLINFGVLVRNEQGQLKVAAKKVKASQALPENAQLQLQTEVLETAKMSLRTHALTERDFSARCLNIREENLPMLKEYIKEFQDKIAELFEESTSSSKVYLVNVNLMPLTKTATELH